MSDPFLNIIMVSWIFKIQNVILYYIIILFNVWIINSLGNGSPSSWLLCLWGMPLSFFEQFRAWFSRITLYFLCLLGINHLFNEFCLREKWYLETKLLALEVFIASGMLFLLAYFNAHLGYIYLLKHHNRMFKFKFITTEEFFIFSSFHFCIWFFSPG